MELAHFSFQRHDDEFRAQVDCLVGSAFVSGEGVEGVYFQAGERPIGKVAAAEARSMIGFVALRGGPAGVAAAATPCGSPSSGQSPLVCPRAACPAPPPSASS